MDNSNKNNGQGNGGSEPDIVLDHDYDGIQEYDNPLPNWWLVTFLGTIIFGFIYVIHYEFGGGPNLKQELAADMAEVKANQVKAHANDSNAAAVADVEKILSDKSLVGPGKAVYDGKCASCHGDKGQGLVGPNLTDNSWIHGTGQGNDLLQVISKGVLDKGMPAWETMLKTEELNQVAAYVFSIRNTNAAGGKPAQGNVVQ